METILKYLPYVLLFAVATMIVYGWGLWRASRQNQDLANMLKYFMILNVFRLDALVIEKF